MLEWLDKAADIIEAGGKSLLALIALAIVMVFIALVVLFWEARSEYIKLASLVLLIVFAAFSIAIAAKVDFKTDVDESEEEPIVIDPVGCDGSLIPFAEYLKCDT